VCSKGLTSKLLMLLIQMLNVIYDGNLYEIILTQRHTCFADPLLNVELEYEKIGYSWEY